MPKVEGNPGHEGQVRGRFGQVVVEHRAPCRCAEGRAVDLALDAVENRGCLEQHGANDEPVRTAEEQESRHDQPDAAGGKCRVKRYRRSAAQSG